MKQWAIKTKDGFIANDKLLEDGVVKVSSIKNAKLFHSDLTANCFATSRRMTKFELVTV